MTKRFLALLITLAGMVLHGFAQNQFTVKTPPFSRYVKVTASSVNLRQHPSTQSARLIWHGEYDELGFGGERLQWSRETLKRDERPAHAVVLPVWESSFLSVVEDADGWLCGAFQGKLVYVMERFCRNVSLRPLSPPAPTEHFDAVKVIETGPYKGYCIGWKEEAMDVPATLEIGKYVNGMFIFNYFIECFQLYTEGKAVFPKIEEHKYYYGDDLLAEDGYSIDLNKLAKNSFALDLLMSISKDIEHHYDPHMYFGIEDDDNWYEIRGVS